MKCFCHFDGGYAIKTNSCFDLDGNKNRRSWVFSYVALQRFGRLMCNRLLCQACFSLPSICNIAARNRPITIKITYLRLPIVRNVANAMSIVMHINLDTLANTVFSFSDKRRFMLHTYNKVVCNGTLTVCGIFVV